MGFPDFKTGLTGSIATVINFLITLLLCAVGLWLLAWLMYWAQEWTGGVIPWPK